MPRYQVMVDDNFHYMDPDERREQGIYDTLDDALAVCHEIVERSLREAFKPGVTAEKLYDHYTSFGEDPFIVVLDGADANAKFSAWNYAKERCRAMCGEGK
jgi:hypothetical protein